MVPMVYFVKIIINIVPKNKEMVTFNDNLFVLNQIWDCCNFFYRFFKTKGQNVHAKCIENQGRHVHFERRRSPRKVTLPRIK